MPPYLFDAAVIALVGCCAVWAGFLGGVLIVRRNRGPRCEECGSGKSVFFEPCRAQLSGIGRPSLLCRSCAAEYHARWDEVWADAGKVASS